MKALAEQSASHGIESGIAQVVVVFALVMPSLFAFLAFFDRSTVRGHGSGIVVLLSNVPEDQLWCDTSGGGFDGARRFTAVKPRRSPRWPWRR